MRIKSPVVLNITRTLYLSLGMEMSLRLARTLIQGYEINKRMGFPPSVPVPVQDAVNRIVVDLLEAGLFLELVEWLVRVDRHGSMGKQYPIAGMDEIIKGMEAEGYQLDPESELFYEDSRRHKTPGWGRLRIGVEYPVTLLHVDIVRNSSLVRTNDTTDIERAYEDFRGLVSRIVEKRRGRLWFWEGDGGLVAFHYGHPTMSAVLCGMELLNDLCIYNLAENALDRDIQVRAAAHAGYVRYSEDYAELARNELVKEVTEIEETYTRPDSLSVSATITPHIDAIIKDRFVLLESDCPWQIISYAIAPRLAAGKVSHGRAAWK
ncbi:MAG: hypothetical protein E4H20_00470 [Spirochaetales bacterium]|nr:MAG: hypothetical protein E4H20_00470 [Spirochaetales bacterium]